MGQYGRAIAGVLWASVGGSVSVCCGPVQVGQFGRVVVYCRCAIAGVLWARLGGSVGVCVVGYCRWVSLGVLWGCVGGPVWMCCGPV